MLSVHGRTVISIKALQIGLFIGSVKDSVSIPVFGNGDVVSVDDAKRLRSGADGLLVGRGTYGRPWFLNQISHFLKLENVSKTQINIPNNTALEHYDAILWHAITVESKL